MYICFKNMNKIRNLIFNSLILVLTRDLEEFPRTVCFWLRMNNREFANQSKKITINHAAAQKQGEAASSIEYRIGVQKPAPKQLNNYCGRQKFFLTTWKTFVWLIKKSIVLIYKHINSSNKKSEDICVTHLGRFKFLRLRDAKKFKNPEVIKLKKWIKN